MIQPIQQAAEYANAARNKTGSPYPVTYRRRLVDYWMNGWLGETLRAKETNYDAPLHHAYGAGRVARKDR